MEKVWKHFAELLPSWRTAAHQNKNKNIFDFPKEASELEKFTKKLL